MGHLDHNQPFAFPLLIGDVGGTNARFALLGDPDHQLVHLPHIKTGEYPGMEKALLTIIPPATQVKTLVIAIAAPVNGHNIALTNSHWIIDAKRLIEEIGFNEVIIVNDLEAVALSLPSLVSTDYMVIGEQLPRKGTKVVVGPGTGLGVSALFYANELYIPVPTEAGHIGVGSMDQYEANIWPHIEPRGGRISAETLISGQGLVNLYNAIVASCGQSPSLSTPEEIGASGLTGKDKFAAKSLRVFTKMLGRFAGDLALAYMTTGGVYIAGGIPQKIAPFIGDGGFRLAFNDKYPHNQLLEEMSTVMITHPLPALKGLAALVRHPQTVLIELTGRRWRKDKLNGELRI